MQLALARLLWTSAYAKAAVICWQWLTDDEWLRNDSEKCLQGLKEDLKVLRRLEFVQKYLNEGKSTLAEDNLLRKTLKLARQAAWRYVTAEERVRLTKEILMENNLEHTTPLLDV